MALALACLMLSWVVDEGLLRALVVLVAFPAVLWGTGTVAPGDLKALQEAIGERTSEVSR